MTIQIDRREGSAELAPLLTSVPTAITTLPFGDFSWLGNGHDGPTPVGVERKRLLDLLNSADSGRFSGHQLIGLQKHYDHVYLVVEGLWRADRESGSLQRPVRGKWVDVRLGPRHYTARALFSFLNTMRVTCGLHVVTTGSAYETALWLQSIYRWWRKPWEKHRAHTKAYTPPPPSAQLAKPGLMVRMVKELDGVGWDRAESLAAHFLTLSSLVHATQEELQEVPGIGPVLASSIKKELAALNRRPGGHTVWGGRGG